MDLLPPANTIFAPAPATDDTGPSIERCVGEIVAAAGATLAEGLGEMERGKLTWRTKTRQARVEAERRQDAPRTQSVR